MDSTHEKNFISTKDASELTGYNSDYLARLCREGKITGTQIGRTWIVDQTSLEAFVQGQDEQKRERAQELSRARATDYKAAQTPLRRSRWKHSGSDPLTKIVRIAKTATTKKASTSTIASVPATTPVLVVSPYVRGASNSVAGATKPVSTRPNTFANTLGLRNQVVALTGAFLITLCAVGIAQAGFVARAGQSVLALAESAHASLENFIASADVASSGTLAYEQGILKHQNSKLAASLALAPLPPLAHTPALYALVATSSLPSTHLAAVVEVPGSTRVSAAAPSISLAALLTETITHPSAVAANITRGYVGVGVLGLHAITGTMDAYQNALVLAGTSAFETSARADDTALAVAPTTRTLTTSALALYTTGITKWVNVSTEVPGVLTLAAYNTGSIIGNIALYTPSTIRQTYALGIQAYTDATPHVLTATLAQEVALGTAVNTGIDSYIDAGRTLGAVAGDSTRAGALALADSTLGTLGTSANALGTTQTGAVAVATQIAAQGTSQVATVLYSEVLPGAFSLFPKPVQAAGAHFALATYEFFHSAFEVGNHALAFLFSPFAHLAVFPHKPSLYAIPFGTVTLPAGTSNSNNALTYIGSGSTPSHSTSGSTVIQNYYTTQAGLTADSLASIRLTVNDQIDAALKQINYRLGHVSSGGGGAGTVGLATISGGSYSNVNISGGLFDNLTLSSSTLSGITSLEVIGSTTLGLLTAGTTTISELTVTNSTTTNFYANNGVIVNASSTNLFADSATFTNATSTNFFATLARATTSIFDNLTATLATITGLNVTDSTTTNATSTNLYAATGGFGNLFSNLATIFGLNVTNSTTTNATTTNLFATNFGIGSSVFNSLLGNGLLNVNGTLTVSTSSLATGFWQQGGNSFGATGIFGTLDSNPLSFITNGLTHLTLDTLGNFGIGTTTPGALLGVAGNGLFSGSVTATNLNATGTLTADTVSATSLTTTGAANLGTLSTTGLANLASLSIGSLSGVLHASSGVVSAGLVNLTSEVSGVLPQANGGTGFGSYTAGDVLVADSFGNLTKLPAGANGEVLKVSAGVPTWGNDNTVGAGGNDGIFATSTGGLITSLDTSNILVLGAGATSSASTQFEVHGMSYFSGNVGIGSTTPFAKLSVVGNANITGSGTFYGGAFVPYLNATSTTATSTFSGGLALDGTFGFGGSYFTSLLGNGLVNTSGSLAVSTTSLASGFFLQNGNSFGATATLGSNDNNALAFKTNGAEVARFDTAGKFGVGTTTPSSKFAVQGNGLFSGDVSLASLTATGTAAISGTATVGNLINNGVSVNTLLYANGSKQESSVTLPSYITLTSGALSIATSSLYTGTTGQFPYFSGTNTITATSSLFLAVNGNVGIGATSPVSQLANTATNQLDGAGNGSNLAGGLTWRANGAGYVASFANAASASLSNGVLINSADTSGNSRLLEVESAGVSKFLVSSNGNVGIGTTTPTTNFSVQGSALFSGDVSLANLTATGTISTAGLTDTGNLQITGGLGVGTTPGGNGTIVTTGSITTGSQFLGLSGDTVSTPSYSWTGDLTTGIYHNTNNQIGFTTGGVNRAQIDANGFLGIATTTAFGRLSVSSDALGASPAFVVGSSSLTSLIVTNAGLVGIGTTSPVATLGIQGSIGVNTSQLYLASNGNVGIGTTSPMSAFAVGSGQIAASSSVLSTIPGYAFSTDLSSGMQLTGGTLSLNTAGTRRLLVDATNITVVANLVPNVDNNTSRSIGSATNRWRALFIGDGNISISTTTPFARLSIQGTAGGTTPLFALSTSTSGFATTTVAEIDQNGNALFGLGGSSVGIGTTTPTTNFSIQGNQYTSGTAFFGGAITATSSLSVTGNTQISGGLGVGVSNTNSGTITSSGSIAAGTQFLGLSADTVSTPSFSWTGDLTTGIYHTTNNQIGFTTGGVQRGLFDANGNFYTSGKIGVASTTPWGLLSVNPTALGSGVPEFVVGSSTATHFLVDGAGSVGVGTTSPFAALSISPSAGQSILAIGSSTLNYLTINTSGQVAIGNGAPVSSTTQLTILPSTSNNIRRIGQGTLGAGGFGRPTMTMQGRYAYITEGGTTNYMEIWDVSVPASPVRVSQSTLNSTSQYAGDGIAVQGRYAYIAEGHITTNALEIWDVSNPTAPVRVGQGTLNNGGNNAGDTITVQGRYAYITEGNGYINNFEVWDVSNPTAPVRVGQTTLHYGSGTSSIDGLMVQGNYAYIAEAGGTNTFEIFDVSNPVTPVRVGGGLVNIGTNNSNGTSLYVQGRYAYISKGGGTTNAFEVWDISNPASPARVGQTNLSNGGGNASANGLYVQGRYAYVTEGTGTTNAFEIFDVSNPVSPIRVAQGTLNNTQGSGLYVQGRYAYIAEGGGTTNAFEIWDLGGAYIQQLETGGIETGALSINGNLSGVSANLSGGLNVGNGGIFSAGPLSVGIASSTQANAISATFQGMVGVGTTSPWAQLSVNGVWNQTGPLFAIGTTTLTGTTTNFIVAQNGNVGVGTTSPTSNLGVQGTLYTSGTAFFGGAITATSTLTVTGNTQISGGLGVGVANTNSGTITSSGTIAAGTQFLGLSADTVSTPSYTWTGDLTTGIYHNTNNQIGFTTGGVQRGLFDANGNFYTSGKIGVASTTPWGLLSVNPNALGSGVPEFVVGSSTATHFVVDGAGNVGIGTTSPFAALSISPSAGQSILAIGSSTLNYLTINTSGQVAIGNGSPVSSTTQLTILPNTSNNLRRIAQGTLTNGPGGGNASTVGDAIVTQGRYTYIAEGGGTTNALEIWDVSVPGSPVRVGQGTLNNGAAHYVDGMVVQGRYAYIAEGAGTTNAFEIWDISNPSAPVRVGQGTLNNGANQGGDSISVQGRYAYITEATGSNGFEIWDISNPTAPVRVAQKSLNNSATTGHFSTNGITVQGRYAYIADGSITTNAFEIWDISNPITPIRVGQGTLANTGSANGMVVQGRYAYITDNGNANNLEIWDVSNPAAPVRTGLGDLTSSGGYSSDMLSVQGRYAYVATGNGSFQVWDVSNPASPLRVAQGTIGSGGNANNGISVQGRYAYIAQAGLTTNAFEVWDLGGAYIQQLETGGIETGALSVSGSFNAANANIYNGLNVGNGGINTTGPLSVGIASSTQANALSATFQGFVGVGTTTPWGQLSINPNNLGSGVPEFVVGSSTATHFLVDGAGRVGVGTTSPFAALSISPSAGQSILAIGSSTLNYLTINTSGQVAIGNGSPVSSTTQLTILPSTSNNIRRIGQGNLNNGAPNTGAGIAVQGRYTYIVEGAGTTNAFEIWDTSVPASPVRVGQGTLNTSQGGDTIVVQGKYAYIVDGGSGTNAFEIWDVSNPAAPVRVGQTSITSNTTYAKSGLFVQGRYAYLAEGGANNGYFEVFDVSNPTLPTRTSSTMLTNGSVYGGADGVIVQGKYAYIVEGSATTNAFEIWDVSNPVTPVRVGQGTLNNGTQYGGTGIAVQGRYAYIAEGAGTTNAFEVWDISNPASPARVGQTSLTNGHSGGDTVSVQGRYAYVAEGSATTNGFEVFDISNPVSPTRVAQGKLNNGASNVDSDGLAIQGRYAYISEGAGTTGAFEIWDLGGAYIQQLETGGIETGALSISGNLSGVSANLSGGLNVGNGGINSSGPLSVGIASSTQANALSATFQGMVGVGTTTPWAQLSVNGAWNSTTPLFAIGTTTLTGTSTAFMVASNGNVGIGTTTPTTNLSVQGNSYTSGTAFFGGAITATSSLSVTGNTQISGGLGVGVSNTNSGTITSSGSIAAGTQFLGVSADTVSTPSYTWSGDLTTGIYHNTNNQIGFTTGGVQRGLFDANGNFYTSGKIGVASTTPWGLLSVNPTALGSGVPEFVVGSSTATHFLVDGAGRVGVGTTSPFAALSISPSAGQSILAIGSSTLNYLTINTSGQVAIGNGSPVSSTTQLTILPNSSNNIRRVGQGTLNNGGSYSADKIIVQGRYAYIVEGHGTTNAFEVWDVSVPASPVRISQSTLNNGNADGDGLDVQGRYAYITEAAGTTNAFEIWDVSNPAAPVRVGQGTLTNTYTIGEGDTVVVQGRYAYITDAGTTNAFQIWDVSNPTAPVRVSQANIANNNTNGAISMTVRGSYAYIDNGGTTNGLEIFDVSNPAAPVRVGSGTLSTSGAGTGIVLQGRYAYLVQGNGTTNAFEIWDVSNPASPSRVGQATLANASLATSRISVQGRYAYVAEGGGTTNALEVFDVSNPVSPVRVAQGNLNNGGNSGTDIVTQGRYAYIVEGSGTTNAFEIWDLGGAYIQQLETGGIETGALSISGNLSGVSANLSGGLNVGNGGIFSAGPLSVGIASSTQANAISATFQGMVGVGTTTPWAQLSVNGIWNSTKPLFAIGTTTLTGTSTPFMVAANGNVGIGTTSPWSQLSIHANAGSLNTTLFSIGSTTAAGATTTLLNFTNTGALGIGTSTPFAALSISPSAGQSVLAIGSSTLNYLTLNSSGQLTIGNGAPVSSTTQLTILPNSSNNIRRVGQGTLNNGVSWTGDSVTVQGRYAYIVEGGGTTNAFEIWDVSVPASPVRVGQGTLNSAAQDSARIVVQGNYAYIINGAGSLTNAFEIWDVSNPSAPVRVGQGTPSYRGNGLAVQGRYAYLADGAGTTNAFEIWDVANPAAPVRVGQGTLNNSGSSNPRDTVVVQGDYAYIADATATTNAFEVWDVSNPVAPVRVGQANLTYGGSYNLDGLAIQGRYAYVTETGTTNSFEIFDISNPASPTRVGQGTTLTSANSSVSVQGRYAYIVHNATTNGLEVWDVSNPVSPYRVAQGTLNNGTSNIGASGLSVQGRYAYIAEGVGTTNAFEVWDLGGAYIQQLETGGIETGALSVSGSFNAANANIYNGLNVGNGGINSTGPLSVGIASSTQANAISATFQGMVGVGTSTPWGLLSINPSNLGSGVPEFVIGSSTTTHLIVTGAGNVGIGTTVPITGLEIDGAGSNASGVMLHDTTAGANVKRLRIRSNSGFAYFDAPNDAFSGVTSQPLTMNLTTGNVGIGTTNPASKLQVTTSGGAALPPTSGTTPSTGELIRLRTSADAAGGIGTIGLSTNQMWLQATDATGLGAGYQLLLNPNGGNVGIGTTNPSSGKLQISGTTGAALYIDNGGDITVTAQVSGSNTNIYNDTGTLNFATPIASSDGTLHTVSDQRLKKNITSINGNDALSKIDQLNPVTYDWINPSVHDNAPAPGGFLAQQLMQVFPEFVSQDTCQGADCSLVGGATSTLEYNIGLGPKFDAYLVAGIQELSTRTQILTATTTLEGIAGLPELASTTLALGARTDALTVRVTSAESRISTLEQLAQSFTAMMGGSSTASSTMAAAGNAVNFSTSTLLSALNSFGLLLQNGAAQIQNMVVHNLVFSRDSNGDSAAGSGTIIAGNLTAEISNPNMKASSKVSLTLTSTIQGSWYLSQKQDGSFRITLSQAQATDTTFDYFIVQTEGQIATTTPDGSSGGISDPNRIVLPNPTTSSSSTSTPSGSGPSNSSGQAGTSTATTTPGGMPDTKGPAVSLNGAAQMQLAQGASFIDPGATAMDDVNGDVSASIVVSGSVDSNTAGTYTITYTASDASGNHGGTSRTVTVLAPVLAPTTPSDTGTGSGSGAGDTGTTTAP